MAYDNIRRALDDLRHRATTRGVTLPSVRVRQGSASEFPEHRAHAYCTNGDTLATAGQLTIVYAPKLATARMRRILGVLAHEYGHAALLHAGQVDHTERDADRAAEALFGVTLAYDAADVQAVVETPKGRPSRPRYLPDR